MEHCEWEEAAELRTREASYYTNLNCLRCRPGANRQAQLQPFGSRTSRSWSSPADVRLLICTLHHHKASARTQSRCVRRNKSKPPLLPSSSRAATLYTPELPGMSFFPQLDHLMLCCEIGLGPSSVPDSGVLMVSSIEEHLRRKENLTLSHQESRLG